MMSRLFKDSVAFTSPTISLYNYVHCPTVSALNIFYFRDMATKLLHPSRLHTT